MKRNLNVNITELDGSPAYHYEFEVGQDGKRTVKSKTPLNLRKVACDALLMSYDEERVTGEDKMKRFKLASRIHGAEGEIEVTAEEVSMLKNLIGKAYGPLVVGQAYDALETDATEVGGE